MEVKDYRAIRQTGKDLTSKIFKFAIDNNKEVLSYHASLFEVKSIDSGRNTSVLIDLLDPNRKEFTLMDIGLSQTSVVGLIFYTRLLPIQDIYMTSGVSFGFENSCKDKLIATISLATFKKRNKLNTTEMFVLMHKKHQHFGLKIKTL